VYSGSPRLSGYCPMLRSSYLLETAEYLCSPKQYMSKAETKPTQTSLWFQRALDQGLHCFTSAFTKGETASHKPKQAWGREWVLCEAVRALLALGAATFPLSRGQSEHEVKKLLGSEQVTFLFIAALSGMVPPSKMSPRSRSHVPMLQCHQLQWMRPMGPRL